MKHNGRMLLAAAACCFLTLILSAECAALSPKNPQQSLEDKVGDYMQAQIDEKWDRVYSFLEPSYREEVSRENFVHRTRKMFLKAFTIETIKILPSGNQATVKVRIDVSFRGTTFQKALKTQHWTKQNGEWFVQVGK